MITQKGSGRAVRMNASFVNELTAAGSSRYGRVVFGDAMYQRWIELDKSGKVTSSPLARIGGGWSKFVDHETSTFNDDATPPAGVRVRAAVGRRAATPTG